MPNPIMQQIEASQTTPKGSEARNCCDCWRSVALPIGDPRWHELDIRCPECEAKRRASEALIVVLLKERNHEAMLARVPKAFQGTDRERLPFPAMLDEAMLWAFGAQGLLLYGPTGCGKSRVAWEVAKREIAAGRKFKAVTAFELSRYPSLLMSDSEAASRFAESLVNVELLMLDDVFKAKPTERVEELLFAVIDERGQWERPCIVTLNDTGATLTDRLSADRGPALIRRLRDYCHAIKFGE